MIAKKLIAISFILGVCIWHLNADAKANERSQGNKIIIELDFIPQGVKPGDKPITLNENIVRRLLPELKKPRLMSYKDITELEEQEGFIEGGYAFVLRGDFDRNGSADIAFVGKYDNFEQPEKNCFLAIVSIKGKKVTREYFSRLETKKAYLLRVPEYKPKIEAIGIIYNLYSEECGYLYWAGKRYDFKPCRSVY